MKTLYQIVDRALYCDDSDDYHGFFEDRELANHVFNCLRTKNDISIYGEVEEVTLFETFEEYNEWWKENWGKRAELDSLTTHPKWSTL